MVYIMAYFCTLVVFFAIDFFWLGFVARDFYASQLGELMREKINYAAAGGFYLFYIAGIVFFAIVPALTDGSWRTAALHGLLLGLLAYGTYDMTNLATIKDWPVAMSLVDMAWGGILTSVKDWPVAMSLVDMAWGGILTSVSATLGYLMAKTFA